jgi:hypothetical protein
VRAKVMDAPCTEATCPRGVWYYGRP